MKEIGALTKEQARRMRGVVFDLDDTLLDHGELSEAAYGALFRLRDAGLSLVACTGRPAGWGEILARQWPIDAVVTENGAVAFVVERAHGGPRRIAVMDELAPAARRERRARLLSLAEELVERFPEVALADDNAARRSDVTLDVGEHRRVSREVVREIRAIARARGVRTLVSSIHLHLSVDSDDKASGTIRLLTHYFEEDATRARGQWAFIGDSANDAAAFAAFTLTFGVHNVVAHVHNLTISPTYLASLPMGRGFAEITATVVGLRASSG